MEPNLEAVRVLRADISELNRACNEAAAAGDAALRRAYPFRADLMDEDFRDFDYADLLSRDETPEGWCREHCWTIHKLMRISFEEGADYAVEALEKDREHVAAQLAYALENSERRRAERQAGVTHLKP